MKGPDEQRSIIAFGDIGLRLRHRLLGREINCCRGATSRNVEHGRFFAVPSSRRCEDRRRRSIHKPFSVSSDTQQQEFMRRPVIVSRAESAC
jgi:hypothetical protein